MNDPNEPPDDKKTISDMLRYPRQEQNFDTSNWKLIGTFVYCPNSEEIRFERAKGLEKNIK